MNRVSETVRAFAADERGGAVLETALLLGLAVFFAFSLREALTPLLDTFTRAAQAVSQALG